MFHRRSLSLLIPLIAFFAPAGVLEGDAASYQCTSEKTDILLISDRYEDAVQWQQQLILANALGLVFLDADAPSQNPFHVEALPGEIVQLTITDSRLWAVVREVGIYAYDLQDGFLPPRFDRSYSIPGLQNAAVTSELIFAATTDGIRMVSPSPFRIIDSLPVQARAIGADDHHLIVQDDQGEIDLLPYVPAGFTGEVIPLELSGNDVFYGFTVIENSLVVDALDGIRWVELGPGGTIMNDGFYFESMGTELVLGYAVDETHMVLSFVDRIGVYALGPARSLRPIGTIPQSFSDVGTTRLEPNNGYVHLLNLARNGRDWSLASYATTDDQLTEIGRQPARFRDLISAAATENAVFFASDREIQQLTETNELETRWVFDGPIQHMITSGDMLLAVTTGEVTSVADISLFQVDDQGRLTLSSTQQIIGDIRDLTQWGGMFAFTRFLRSTTQDDYTAYLLDPETSLEIQTVLTSPVAIDNPPGFRFYQVGAVGLIHMEEDQLIVTNPDTRERTVYTLADIGEPVALAVPEDEIWIETANGLVIGEADGRFVFPSLTYPNWRNLSRQVNNLILATDADEVASDWNMLERNDDFVFAKIAFSAATEPSLITENGGRVIVAEQSTVGSFDCACAEQDQRYLIPLTGNFELDLRTDLEADDLISMFIYDRSGHIIGLQRITPETIAIRNGSRTIDWITDYDHGTVPYAALLVSNIPAGAVLSGRATTSDRSRFALQQRPVSTTDLYAPHVPKDLQSWRTNLWVSNYLAGDSANLQLTSANEELVTRGVRFGESRRVTIDSSTFTTPTPWARLRTDDLGAFLSGFEVIQVDAKNLAAAVPLVEHQSGTMFVPFLAGKGNNPGWWTGMVLANPHDAFVETRIIVYNTEGEIDDSLSLMIPPNDSLVVQIEAWLAQISPQSEPVWLAVVADPPIMGMTIIATYNQTQLAGLPLTGDASDQLIFSGVRNDTIWRTSLVVTNINREPTELVFTAISGRGEVIGSRIGVGLASRGSLEFSVESLFSSFSERLDEIQTIRVESRGTELIGFMLRRQRTSSSLEAVSPIYSPVVR